MYQEPQWEVIYTVTNSSDSQTQWRDGAGRLHGETTQANSLLAVLVRVLARGAGARPVGKRREAQDTWGGGAGPPGRGCGRCGSLRARHGCSRSPPLCPLL